MWKIIFPGLCAAAVAKPRGQAWERVWYYLMFYSMVKVVLKEAVKPDD
jgi:hypothetical protein